MIDNFQGANAFLSMFYDQAIVFEGITYKNAEAAFQAQKTDNELLKKKFSRLLPTEAIRRGNSIHLRDDWNQIKDDLLYQINLIKFSDEKLKQKLLDTNPQELINSNNFKDMEYGVFEGKGENKLGKVLMRIREELLNGRENTQEKA